MAGSGFFSRAVQEALLDGQADLAVHSYKDLPSAPTPGLKVAAVPKRADPREVLLLRRDWFEPKLAPLPVRCGATVGTSAIRRQTQLQGLRPDLEVRELRGNVLTRIQKLRDGQFDAILVAAAGVQRLAFTSRDLVMAVLEPEVIVPAPAQGALALEIRQEDTVLEKLVSSLHDTGGYPAIAAERGLMAALQAGCQLALGAYARCSASGVTLLAWFKGRQVSVQHETGEGAARLALEALERA